MSRVRVRTAMGGLLALVMMSTAPVRAAEPDRQDKQPLDARTSPGSPIHLVVRDADRGVNNDSDYSRGMMGNNPLAVKGLPCEEALSANRGDRQSFYLNRTALILGQTPLRTGLLEIGLLRARENPVKEYAPLFELRVPPNPLVGTDGSHAFRTPLRPLSQWSRVVAEAGAQVDAMTSCNPAQEDCGAEALLWQEILREAGGLPLFEQLQTVNAYFNRWPYRLDIEAYGASEYWATPREFLQHSGDCEDYCTTKYFALKQLGVPAGRMNIVLLIDAVSNTPHAVLAVRYGQDSYVLDNLSDQLLPYQRYTQSLPLYSLNERYRWAYIASGLMPRPALGEAGGLVSQRKFSTHRLDN